MLSYARVLCNSARELLTRATLEALDPRLLRRPLACSWRLLSKITAVVARSLILESAQHELEHLVVIAHVYVSLSLRLSLRLSPRPLSASLSATSLCVSLCVFSLSLYVSSLYVAFSLRLIWQNTSSRPPSLRSPQLVSASASARCSLCFSSYGTKKMQKKKRTRHSNS